ncbi:MAG: ATP-dependent sacrificial sulfur transferase LarE [Candidatus Lutacidiplasmatales archaeon]
MATLVAPTIPIRSAEELVARIRSGGRALVAMSGGVDSSLVAALAHSALADGVVAVTLAGPAVSRDERSRAEHVAASIGVSHVILEANPLSVAGYRQNGADRCYFCRAVETSALREFGATRSVAQYLDGIHRDDLGEDRPGIRAMDEAGFLHPLVWSGWGKAEVRVEARRRGLPNWDQPSDACLASRIAHGDPVTVELLAKVESAEALVAARGFRRVRVRVRAGTARVEVDPSDVPRLLSEPLASEVTAEVGRLGFTSVTIDRRGYHGVLPASPTVP